MTLKTLKSVTYIQMLTSIRYHSKSHRYSNNFYVYRNLCFILARTSGWISHWLEMHSAPYKIGRPRQLYTGYTQRDFVAVEDQCKPWDKFVE